MFENEDPIGDEPIQEDAPKPAAPPDPQALIQRAEAAERRAAAAEQDREAWFNRYQQAAQQPKELAAPAPVIEPEDDEDFDYLDATANGKSRDIDNRIEKRAARIAKQIVKETLEKGGFVSREDAQQIAVQQAESIRESAQLVQEYPDLTIEGTALRAEAQKQLSILEQDPDYMRLSPIKQARIAAERAQIELYRTGRMANTPPDPNAERQQRIRAQQGNFTNYNAPAQERESELTPGEKQMAKIFGVSEKNYIVSKNTHRYRR